MNLLDVLDRIDRRLKAVGLDAANASRQAGLSEDAIRNMRRAAKRGQTEGGANSATITALAPVLKTHTAWLLDNEGPEEASELTSALGPRIERFGSPPPYAGIVQAGQFLAVDEYFNQDPEQVPAHVLPDPNYMKVRQYAWQSRGDSMDEAGIGDGMWIVGADAADYIDQYGDIVTGDYVVVERTRFQGAERELTVKEVHFFRGRYELRPVSSNPEHKPISVPHDHITDSDGMEIKIIGVVLTAYANLKRRAR